MFRTLCLGDTFYPRLSILDHVPCPMCSRAWGVGGGHDFLDGSLKNGKEILGRDENENLMKIVFFNLDQNSGHLTPGESLPAYPKHITIRQKVSRQLSIQSFQLQGQNTS